MAGEAAFGWCGDIGNAPRDVAEAALAHSLTATEGAYRRMTVVERRREVMTRYADWLNDESGKVLAFPTGRSSELFQHNFQRGRGISMLEEGDGALRSSKCRD
jgi:hypothetical protein